MPTPDKTMDDVSKLVAEARALAEKQNGRHDMCSVRDCDFVKNSRAALRALADALESVAKENEVAAGALRNTRTELHQRNGTIMELQTQLAAVAKERDALREALEYYADEKRWPAVAPSPLMARAALAAQSKPQKT
jgi:DNA repair exonuclease SbcCD ATPase subunit